VAAFGTDHFYQADGFFDTGSQPWSATAAAGSASDAFTASDSDSGSDSGSDPSMDTEAPVAPNQDAYNHSRAAFEGLARTDPEAVWVYQTWIWRGWSTAAQLGVLRGWLGAIPAGRSLLLDQTAEWQPLWQRYGNYSFFGTPFVW
jgi:hypothetical protein